MDRERVLHHALMRFVGPVLDRSLIADTYACREGKGTLAAARRAQNLSRRFSWVAKLDVAAYFASIDHEILRRQLRRRVKGRAALDLIDQIIGAYAAAPGKGLPIGALTSQHFANLYLSPLDRFLGEQLAVDGLVRYMDDTLIWQRDRWQIQRACREATHFASESLGLTIKPGFPIQRAKRGVTICGFRVGPTHIGLSQRRRQRYGLARRRWERAYELGEIDQYHLQRGFSSVLAITAGADAQRWRRAELGRRPALDL